MVTEIISVGTEILLGNIVNTNSAYLSEMCARLGLSVYYESVVGDNEKRMAQVIKTALERSDVVILTGGLGPTEDDLTKEVTAQVMGVELKEDKHVRKRIEKYMEIYAKNHAGRKITANNWKQAMVPEGALVLENSNGTAPGLIIEKDGKTAILLPGPPNELKPLFEEQVYPYLRKRQPHVIYSQMVKIAGIGESQVADEIKDLIHSQTNPTIAPYAKPGEVHLRITAKADSEKEGKTILVSSHILSEISMLADDIGILDHGVLLEEETMEELKKKNQKYILLQVSDTAATARILEQQMALQGGEYSIQDTTSVKIFKTTIDREALVRELTLQGVGLSGLAEKDDTLEDYFKKITGGEGIA